MSYVIDDRFIISERIKNMTPEEKISEIAKLEKEAAKEKQKILRQQSQNLQADRP